MHRMLLALSSLCLLAGGCTVPLGTTCDQKRQAVLNMRWEALARLYSERPEAMAEVDKSPGYAVFSNVGATCLFAGAGAGYGVVVDRATGQKIFMRMGQVSAELGAGVTEFRVIYVFRDTQTMHRFIEDGWQLGGEAQANFVSHAKGAEVRRAALTDPQVRVYQFTQAGVVLRAGIPVAKYWRYDELN